MLESLYNKATGPEGCFTEQLRWLPLIILDYIILYQIRKAHPLTRRITSTLYEFS